MKTFTFDARAEFEAKDLDDAFRLIETHFRYLQGDMEFSSPFEFTGEMRIKPKRGESPSYTEEVT